MVGECPCRVAYNGRSSSARFMTDGLESWCGGSKLQAEFVLGPTADEQ